LSRSAPASELDTDACAGAGGPSFRPCFAIVTKPRSITAQRTLVDAQACRRRGWQPHAPDFALRSRGESLGAA